MKGSINIPFSELFADTLKMHGEIWCYVYYVIERKMEEWEYYFWVKSTLRNWG